jgi:hypothetical protein
MMTRSYGLESNIDAREEPLADAGKANDERWNNITARITATWQGHTKDDGIIGNEYTLLRRSRSGIGVSKMRWFSRQIETGPPICQISVTGGHWPVVDHRSLPNANDTQQHPSALQSNS